MSRPPPPLERYSRAFPSGSHAGERFRVVESLTMTGVPPAAGITNTVLAARLPNPSPL